MYTSTRSNNAIRIVIDMMRHREVNSSVADIAQRQELPVIYTKTLLIPLVKSTIIKKEHRGFKLGKTTDTFTFRDIIQAVN